MNDLLEGVTWYRQSSVRVHRAGTTVHVDPWGVPDEAAADYILLTHPHYDTFSEDDIARVRDSGSVVVAPASMKKLIVDADHLLRPGDLLSLEGIEILAVPAFNREKRYHPADAGWLGYVFTVDGVTYYHAGDTDYHEAMADIRCDVAFLPCEGQYTMGPEEAVRAAEACHARVVVPVHWGGSLGHRAEAERMVELLPERVAVVEPDLEGPDEGEEPSVH